jgi:hypothetical protein
MNAANIVRTHFLRSLDAAEAPTIPYAHWLLSDALPADACEGVAGLPHAAAEIGDTRGKRETHNSVRVFFGASERAEHAVCDRIAAAFQHDETVDRLQTRCGIDLGGTFLRIEYCQDRDGFWLEPHTDIGAKLFTMLIYLSTDEGADDWGTDIYADEATYVGTAPHRFNGGLIFVPGPDTWHGFRKRPIGGVRRSLIVNYVKPEWRSRHELAYPDQPVG